MGMRLDRISLTVGVCALAVVLVSSCAAPSRLAEGEYRLAGNAINIYGADDVTPGDLSPYIKQKPASFRLLGRGVVVLDSASAKTSAENIASHMDYLGYYGSTVTDEIVVRGDRAIVRYNVYAGRRIPIESVVYEVPDGEFAVDFYADTANVTVRPGDWLREDVLERESARSASWLRSRGYYGFTAQHYSFEADTMKYPGRAVLYMGVREHVREGAQQQDAGPLRKSRIGKVTISHSSALPFRRSVLEGLNTVKPGQMYDERVINTTYSRLSALNVFSSVAISLSRADSTHVDCDINLSESRVQGFEVDLEASTNSSGLMGISPQLKYHHKNFFNGGEWLNLSFLGNFQFKPGHDTRATELGVTAGLSFPKFLGLPYRCFKGPSVPRTEINLSYSYQDRPEYMRNIFSASFGYTGTVRMHWQYQLYPLQVNMVRLFELDPDFFNVLASNPFMKYSYQNHFDAGVGGVLYYSSSPRINPDATYWYTRLAVDLSGNVLSAFKSLMDTDASGASLMLGAPFSQFCRAEWTLSKTWVFGEEDRSSIAARLVSGVGYAYGNSSSLPFEKQFYVGGANSMRGWQSRALGPGASLMDRSFSIPSQTGDVRIEANAEYRFPLVWKLAGAAFVDVGNVWTLMDKNDVSGGFGKDFYKTLAADWGFGVRADLNVLVVRIDVGIKFRDPVGGGVWLGPRDWVKSDGYAVHFGVGYPF